MNKKISVSIALSITIIAMTVTFAITFIFSMRIFDSTVAGLQPRVVLNNKVTELDKYVRGNYYGDIEDNYLGDRTARGYIDGLRDPYAVYYTAAEYTELQNIESGKLPGIGIEIMRDANGYYTIIKVYEDSPAEKAGITTGGVIEAVDTTEAKNFVSSRTLYSALRGEVGTTVTLSCRYQDAEVKEFTVQRDNYTTPTVFYQKDGNIAHIRITAFGAQTYADFDYTVRLALREGAEGFVFDVRGYPATEDMRSSGDTQYNQVYQMIDMLCPLGTVAKAEYKNGTTKLLKSSDDENKVDLPMVVVVNNYTAGPGELFATSIRDLAGGEIVGSQTAGRGMLPSPPQRMTDGSAVVITTAKLLTSNGSSFDGTGLLPDVEVESDITDEVAFYNVDIQLDRQIIRAVEVLRTLAKTRGIELTASTANAGADVSAPQSGTDENSSSDTQADESSSGETASSEGEETPGEESSSSSGSGSSSSSSSSAGRNA